MYVMTEVSLSLSPKGRERFDFTAMGFLQDLLFPFLKTEIVIMKKLVVMLRPIRGARRYNQVVVRQIDVVMLKKIVGLTESQHIAHRSPYAVNIPLGKMIVEQHVKVLIDRQLPRHPFHFRHPVFQQLLAFLELNDAVLNRNGLRYGDGGQVGYVSSDGGNEQNGNIGDEKAAKNLRLLKNRYPPLCDSVFKK